jgi:hypothetical protein
MKRLSTAMLATVIATGALWCASSRLHAGDGHVASPQAAEIDCAALTRNMKHLPENPTVDP